ncbi:hypothetical protein EMN47_20100 [Prolixibacteraceae bacterium JC049]|nr:hypothetical protein [Prolixibacteraceae bacterium JC049]
MNNWKEINSLTNKFFTTNVYVSELNNILPFEDSFDFLIVFNSTEERTLEYAKLFKSKHVENCMLVDFKGEESDFKSNNLIKNTKLLSSISKSDPIIVNGLDIFSYEESIENIIERIPLLQFGIDSKCLIDITGVPLIYSTTIFKLLKQKFPSPELYLLNVSAKYEKGTNSNYQFSEGERENIYIPGFYGKPDFSKNWLYIFLLGFEGNRSLSILKQNQPDFIEAVIAEPGYQVGYKSKAIEINKSFFAESNISEDEIIRVDAGDPVALCEKVLQICIDYEESNICIVPLGTKPHSIGAGLAAIINDSISIMYQVPKKYSMNNTKSGELLWIYKIK